jgi:hypothetical protein
VVDGRPLWFRSRVAVLSEFVSSVVYKQPLVSEDPLEDLRDSLPLLLCCVVPLLPDLGFASSRNPSFLSECGGAVDVLVEYQESCTEHI